MGRTQQFAEVTFDKDQPEGQIVSAEITATSGTQLLGRASLAWIRRRQFYTAFGAVPMLCVLGWRFWRLV